jgi:hypothetical protein
MVLFCFSASNLSKLETFQKSLEKYWRDNKSCTKKLIILPKHLSQLRMLFLPWKMSKNSERWHTKPASQPDKSRKINRPPQGDHTTTENKDNKNAVS